MPIISCSVPACEASVYAKAMCRLHYRRTRPRTPDKKVTRPCVMCGTLVERSPRISYKYGATCSELCRTRIAFGWSEPLPALHWARMYGATCKWKAPVTSTPARFTSGRCADCATWYIAETSGSTISYCSKACSRRTARRARRAREQSAPGSFTQAQLIRLYLNQGKACAYCEMPVIGLPDPEHVLPLSRGGRNDTTNLVAACRECNTDKGDLTLVEWAASRLTRGLTRVNTDTTTPAFSHLVASEPSQQAWRDRQRAG